MSATSVMTSPSLRSSMNPVQDAVCEFRKSDYSGGAGGMTASGL